MGGCMEYKYIDGLMGFVIGDVLGIPLKNELRENLLKNPVTKLLPDSKNHLPEGRFSDVTSMMIATIDSINNKNMIDLNDIMFNFLAFRNHASYTAYNEVLEMDPVFDEVLRRYDEVRDNPLGYGVTDEENPTNGALVRILPIAYYAMQNKFSDIEILKLVEEVCALTHKDEVSIMACYIFVRFVLFLLSGKDKLSAYSMVRCVDYSMFREETQEKFSRILHGDVPKLRLSEVRSSDSVIDTLEATFWVLFQSQSYMEAIIGAINLGGSTSAIGALTGALCGICYGYDLIPVEWKEAVMRKEYLLDIFEEFSENKYE